MENWALRKLQSERIIGTADPRRLADVVAAARAAVDLQAIAAPPAPAAGWESLGPDNVPGRIGALGISHQDSRVLYAGSAAGGVFKTVDGGATWRPLWAEQDSLAIGGLAVAPSNHDVVYVATGEWEDNVSSTPYHHFPGVGVYVTRDGGLTWRLSPIPSTWTTAVAVDRANADRVFVAGDRALHRSRDGAVTWDTRPGHPDGIFTGTITDVAIDPGDPTHVYIGVHRSGVWRSTDGGDTWSRLSLPGITDAAAPTVISPKLGLCRRPAGATFVAVLLSIKADGRVFTSDDGGDTFVQRDSIAAPAAYAAWCTTLAVDPTDPSVMLAGHIALSRSTRGGRDWRIVGGDRTAAPSSPVHADQQAIVFDPRDHTHVYVATDGGVCESRDGGATWAARSVGLVTTQCYTVALSRANPLRLAITTQDNRAYQSEGSPTFDEIYRDEGGWIEYDPADARILYIDTRSGEMSKSTDAGEKWTKLGIQSDAAIREALAIARTNPLWLLVVDQAGHVRRSIQAGASWTTTLAPPDAVICGVEYAPSDPMFAYAVGTTGRVWCSDTGGATWTELARDGLPAQPVNDIEVDPANPQRVFLAFGANAVTFGADTRAVWRGEVTSPTQATWTDISGDTPATSLPPRLPVTALAIHPDEPETLFASHLLGVHRTVDGGRTWQRFDEGLPRCFVADLDVHGPTRTLYLATMGRGIYRWAL